MFYKKMLTPTSFSAFCPSKFEPRVKKWQGKGCVSNKSSWEPAFLLWYCLAVSFDSLMIPTFAEMQPVASVSSLREGEAQKLSYWG